MDFQFNYTGRNFDSIKRELQTLVSTNYPDLQTAFNDGGIGNLLLELNAGVGDILSYHTDRQFQETQREYAQNRASLLGIANTLGFRIPGRKPSMTVVSFTVSVPSLGDTFDNRYLPVIRQGAQVRGGGKIFETLSDIDFNSSFSANGIPNRLINPIRNANGVLLRYEITKNELVFQGETRTQIIAVTENDSVPFYSLFLREPNVLSVEQIIVYPRDAISGQPTLNDFLNPDYRFYEVESLAENQIFIEDPTSPSDIVGFKRGKWVPTNRKFITEYNDRGFLKITFGNGGEQDSELDQFIFADNIFGAFTQSSALGVFPAANTRVAVRYRVGGGGNTNVNAGVLVDQGSISMLVTGPDENINSQVRQSLSTFNELPAIGGADEPSNEFIRNYIAYNFSSQGRAVTTRDYLATIARMPGTFGVPFRSGVREFQNKIQIYTLYLDANSRLSNTSTTQFKQNLAEWLSYYRMINDYVEIIDGRIINLAVDVAVLIEPSFSNTEIVVNVINEVSSYFDVRNRQMNENIYIGNLIENINNIPGIINVSSIRFFNKVGGEYSINEINQTYIDNSTREIQLIDNTIFGEPTSMFEIKFPNKDITVRLR